MSAKRPNILLINCDDLGWGDPSCYGSTMNRTPYIDRMAAEGMRFTEFYMPSPVCSPSRGGMLTGCYPPRVGFGDFGGRGVLFPGDPYGLNPEETTIAGLLRESGYATHLIGKWHCGDQPEFLPGRHGFDSYYGLPYSNDMGRQKDGRDYPPLPLMEGDEVIQEQPDQASLTERYVERAVRLIRSAGASEKPFFLYFAHMYVHLPLYTPARFLRESANRYAAAVACVDWSVGVLLNELKRAGLDEETLVLFTSDNGSRCDFGPSNGPLRGGKRTCWEGGQRLPLVARWPGTISSGRVCEELATAMDFLPTFAALAGGEPPADRKIDGKDIGALLFGEPGAASPHDRFYYYFGNRLEAVRDGRWKLHVCRHVQRDGAEVFVPVEELYDLKADPGETVDRSAEEPDTVRRLSALAEEAREDLGDAATARKGRQVRPQGVVESPVTLTQYDPGHPYIVAMYDLSEAG